MLERIRELCASPHRGSATPEELAAAAKIAGWMRELGAADVQQERFRHPGQGGLPFVVHFGLLLLAGLCGLWRSDVALAVSLLVAVSLYGALTMRFRWLGRLTALRTSANVIGRIAPASGSVRQTLILCAHHDTQKPGLLFRQSVQRAVLALERHPEARNTSPFLLSWLAALAQCALLGAMAARCSWVPPAALLGPIAVHAVTLLVLGQWTWCRGWVMGANDNATGVAVMLEAGSELVRQPLRHCEVLLLSSGCEEAGCGGVLDFLKRHARELDRRSTAMVVVDTVGAGALRYMTDEHMLGRHRACPELLSHLEALRGTEAFAAIRPYSMGLFTDATAAMAQGYRAVALIGMDLEWVVRHYHQPSDTLAALDPSKLAPARDLVLALLRRVDGAVGQSRVAA